jgi:A/G-specific adenine glycosylase
MQTFIYKLETWYQKNKRDLPWRKDRNPYQIWLSEVLSQQTTMTAVIPYYTKFIEAFPDLETFANSSLEDILKLWTGLGYPSRARNLHKAAIEVFQKGYPTTYKDWLSLPGVGPYTAAAVSSIAFGARKGVVDGNVIRVCSRFLGEPFKYWLPKERNRIQDQMDQWIQLTTDPASFNQAIMELGATVCTRSNPNCHSCPIAKLCKARQHDLVLTLPLTKPKKEVQKWAVQMKIIKKGNKFLVKKLSQKAPFLKSQWSLPITFKKISKKPPQHHFTHSITHNQIFVKVCISKGISKVPLNSKWWTREQLLSESPFSLLEKALSLDHPN